MGEAPPEARDDDRRDSQEVDFPQLAAQQLANNPSVKQLLNQLVNEKVEAELARRGRTEDAGKKKRSTSNKGNDRSLIKSPSDTTIYVPALQRGRETQNAITKISNFVETMRLDRGSPDDHNQRSRSRYHDRSRSIERVKWKHLFFFFSCCHWR